MTPWLPSEHAAGGAHRPEIRYEARECRLRRMPVWAILTQASGAWSVVNCLDKESVCEQVRCAFVCRDGAWPFDEPVDHKE